MADKPLGSLNYASMCWMLDVRNVADSMRALSELPIWSCHEAISSKTHRKKKLKVIHNFMMKFNWIAIALISLLLLLRNG